MSPLRDIELPLTAQADIADILDRSAEDFGFAGRRRYEALIAAALEEIRVDPTRSSSRDRPELGAGTRTYHLRRSRERTRTVEGIVRSPRHPLIYER